MRNIDLQKSQTISTIEKLYADLYAFDDPLTIRLPNEIEDTRIIARGLFLQFILTWASRYPEAAVCTYLKENQYASGLDNLFNDDYGLLAALCAQTHGLLASKQFIGSSGKAIDKFVIFKAFCNNIERFRGLRRKGDRAYIAINDWIEETYPSWDFVNIYGKKVDEGTTSARHRFRETLLSMVSGSIDIERDLFREDTATKKLLPELTTLFYELVENADRWGRRDLDEKAVRSTILQVHTQSNSGRNILAFQQRDCAPVNNYLSSLDNSRLKIVEVSIVDNGPGLAGRLSGKRDQSVSKQYEDVMKCFMRWSGSGFKENEGQGLYRVIRILNSIGGFLHLRTQNLHLFRDFRNNPIDPSSLSDLDNPDKNSISIQDFSNIFHLNDFVTGSRRLRKHPAAIGTLFTFLAPLEQ